MGDCGCNTRENRRWLGYKRKEFAREQKKTAKQVGTEGVLQGMKEDKWRGLHGEGAERDSEGGDLYIVSVWEVTPHTRRP